MMAASAKPDDSEEQLKKRHDLYTKQVSESSFLGGSYTRLVIHFSNGRQLKVRSFEEAAAHAEVSENTAVGFNLDMLYGRISISLKAESDSLETELTLQVSPSGSESATTCFSVFRRWLRSIQAPRWQQWWCLTGPFRFILWVVFAAAVGMVWVASQGDVDSEYYKQQAQEILRHGVTPDKQQKALETLLALQSGYAAPIAHNSGTGKWFLFFVIGGTIVCLILSYPPKLMLGLGPGEDKIRHWRRWTRYVFVVVPTFVASNFLWPVLSGTIRKLMAR
jgi:type IV secretory pathway VirB2 component (pilin)